MYLNFKNLTPKKKKKEFNFFMIIEKILLTNIQCK